MRTIFIACLLALLSACASVGEFKATNYAGADAGRVVMGIGESLQSPNTSYTFYIRKVGNKNGTFLKYSKTAFFDKEDYSNAKEQGIVDSVKLAPGNYEIYSFRVYQVSGPRSSKDIYPIGDFSIPFTIAPNTVTYIGNYQSNSYYQKNMFGVMVPSGGVFAVSNREASDMALVKRKFPNDAMNKIINSTPSATSIGCEFFVDAS